MLITYITCIFLFWERWLYEFFFFASYNVASSYTGSHLVDAYSANCEIGGNYLAVDKYCDLFS